MCDRVIYEYLFLIVYCLDNFFKQKMFDEAVDDSLATLKLFLNWFVTSKLIKKILRLFMQMKIYSILRRILVMFYLIVMEWAFLIQILIILILIIILRKMILILLFLWDFWIAISNLKNAKHLKKYVWRINASNVAS